MFYFTRNHGLSPQQPIEKTYKSLTFDISVFVCVTTYKLDLVSGRTENAHGNPNKPKCV